ncbi:MAG: phytanoyl-CoA dioxygenase family protein [Hyphomicrobiales bacterium]
MDIPALKAQYERDGCLVVENLFPGELVADLQNVTRGYEEAARNSALEGEKFDIIDAHSGDGRELRRIVDPELVNDTYDRAMRYGPLVDLVQALLGGTVRFDHGKLNFKPPSGGAAVEWHQDWAFYPQTNDDMLAVGVMVEDCSLENGPLMVVPGSHKGEIFDHHTNGQFTGGINAAHLNGELERAIPITGKAGSISIHHVRCLHGSTANRSEKNRPLLLFNYVAVDAFPIFHNYDWDEFNARILRGEPTFTPRLAPVPVRIHKPTPQSDKFSTGSLFELQQSMEGTLYN